MDKYTSGAFASTKYSIYKSAQDIITSFPATVIADGQSASAVIKGNLQQSGTPTPSSPIYTSECGDLATDKYIIPILSGGITTNVDLSITSSTRQVKKLVLTGSETSWRITGTGRLAVEIPVDGILGQLCYCSHYKGTNVTSLSNLNNGECEVGTLNTSNNQEFALYDTSHTSVADFKIFLSEQLAASTPVTVWYVLATPQTTTLNEPLRKISTYADTVSVSGIPTTSGSASFNVDTTLKPSEVDLTYNGWHMYADKKYTSGAWS